MNGAFPQAVTALVAGSLLLVGEVAGKEFLLLPVTTELQRSLIASSVSAYGVVNIDALIQDGKINAKALDVEGFRRELAGLAKDHPGALLIDFRSSPAGTEPAAEKLLQAAITQFGIKAGFEKVRIGTIRAPNDWKEVLDQLEQATRGKADGEEAVIQDGLIRVWPVRTKLSRWLAGNADCIVEVRQPFDGRQSGITAEARDAIIKAVKRLDIENKRMLMFRVRSTSAGERVLARFEQRDPHDTSTPEGLAKSMGFGASGLSHTPLGGAPESLLGKTAPDFSLKNLAGQDVNLRDTLHNRVALITFWGVACGPCQQEAPHLSALYEKQKGSNFTVVAVNAYDEQQDVVASYVEQAKLQHPIVLMGRQVARQKYFVGAYPTTFWVDSQGIIIDYVVGFDPGDEAQWPMMIAELQRRTAK